MKMKKLSFYIIGTITISLVLSSCINIPNLHTSSEAPDSIGGFALQDMAQPTTLWDGAFPPVSTMAAMNLPENSLTSLSGGRTIGVNLTIPQTFAITRPEDKITTTYDKYFITGTSDPKLPLYIGQTEIERQGSKGVFGVHVSLKTGANQFTFKQGDQTKTVTITRKGAGTAPIAEIQQVSMVPAHFSLVKDGGELELACVAPSGAAVTAAFNGQSVKLKQTAQAKNGIPAVFKATIPVTGSYDADITQKAGKVTYRLAYNGKTKSYTSTGDVYVAGKNSAAAVRVKSYMGFVYPNLSNLSIFKEKLKAGAVDFIKSQDNTYAALSSGGFVSKEQLEVVTGHVSVGNKLGKVSFSGKAKAETYTFASTNKPAYATKLADGKFSIIFYNTTDAPQLSAANSKLFSGVTVNSDERSVTYTFTQKNAGLWGYDVSYTDKGTVLTFKYKPKLSSGSKPLEGITVVLDPGHGGTDKGALGFAPKTGPTETDVNLAHAYATRNVLEAMGAKVALTRWQDVYYSLDDRLRAPQATNADVFVSIHHNSIGENVDANKITGVEVYYHTQMSRTLANSMMTTVTANMNRNARFVSQSYYRVTLSPYSPAILLELGYLSNPLEYEKSANQAQIDRVALAIADGIKRALA